MTTLTNADIATALDELGDLYELDGVIQYRVIAYRTAAQSVRDATGSVTQLVRDGRVTELPGVGKTLDEKLRALVDTGDIPAAQKLREKYPNGLIAIMHLPGFGAKRARRLYDELGIDSLEALRAAVEQHQLRGLKGFGPKVEEQLEKALAAGADGEPAPRILLSRALAVGEEIVAALREHPAADRVELAGSLRRLTDSVKDIDVIATATDVGALTKALADLPIVETARAEGDAGARVTTYSGMSVDLRVVEPDQFGNVLQHLTGSAAHNIQMREAMVRRGLHVSEYGILDDATGETTRCPTEKEVYERLGLAWIPPELREGRGELEAAAPRGPGLPTLVTLDDIRGDMHSHTTLSDGKSSAEDMALAARERGYEYLAFTDHSSSHGFGDDVQPDELERQIEHVRELNERIDGIELLIGTETNILPDGSVDYDDDLLSRLDWVVASVHTAFRMSEAKMTERMVAAIEHPWVDAIGHPTGRKIQKRRPYEVDVEGLIEAAARTGTMLEINAAPDRRDLNEHYARAAARAGVWILVNADAHSIPNMDLMRYGVATARRAWLTAEQVANTRPWPELAKLRKRASR